MPVTTSKTADEIWDSTPAKSADEIWNSAPVAKLAVAKLAVDDLWDKAPGGNKTEQDFFLSNPGKSTGELHNYLQGADPTMGYAGAGAIGEVYALDNPTINSGEDFGNAYKKPLIELPKPENKGVFSGIVRGAETLAEGLTSPLNLVTMAALGGAPSIIQKAAGIGFSAQMAKGAGDKAAEIIGDHQNMTGGEIAEKSTEALGEAGLAALGLKHTTGRPKGGGSTVAERPIGLQPDGADLAARENQMRTLTRGVDENGNLLPEKVYRGDAKSADPEALQGIALSYAKRVEQLKSAPEEQKPAIQQEIDQLDEQLQQFDRKEAYDAIAKAKLPGEATPAPVKQAAPSNVIPLPEQRATAAPTEAPASPTESAGPAPSETLPPVEDTTSVKPAAEVVIDDIMAKAVSDSAERIADQVSQGQPTSVREAARDAALDNGMSSLRGGKQFSVSFMRKSAQEAAGKAAGKVGESLDTPVGESEKTKLDTTPAPEMAPENKELLSAMDKAIEEALPARDATILNGFKEGRTLDDIAKEVGLSSARVGQIIKGALPKLKKALEDAGFTKEDYMGGPGAMGPVEAMEMKLREHETTGLKRAVVDTERLSRGAEPIPTVERQREAAVVRDAEDLAASDPTATPSLISRIVDHGDTAISEKDAALLLVERARLMNERSQWEERLGDAEQTATAKTRLTEIENEMNRLDLAQRAAGSTWGRLGHMYQRMIRDDYTLESLERKLRAAKQGPLTEGERAKIKEQAAKIEDLQKQADETRSKIEQQSADTETTRIFEATINELGKSFLEKPGYGKEVFDIAKGIVERWKNDASSALERLKTRRYQSSGGLSTAELKDLAIVARAYIGEFGLKGAELSAQLAKDIGEWVTPHFKKIETEARKLIALEKTPAKVKEVVKGGISKPDVETPAAAGAAAKAEVVAGEGLSHKTAYETVEAVINSGIHGEGPVFAEAHKILKESFPELTERDVRRAYTEYGKAKFPSKDATKVELAELRRLGQLQESIDRIQKDALDPLKSGLQRDKASLAVREKTKQLNELLKKREGPPSEEKLASRDQAKQTALKNRIEELDKQLKTGEKPVKTGSSPDSTATEQLRAERDAMMEKLREIQEAENPGMTPEERYNATRLKAVNKRIETLEAKLKANDFTRPAKKVPPIPTKDLQEAQVKLARVKKEIDAGIEKERLKNRTASQKFWDNFVGIERAMKLSSDVVLAKLGTAALAREGILTPTEEAVGGLISKVIPGIAARAPREGGINFKAEAKAKVAAFTEGMKDAANNLRMRQSDLEAMYGKDHGPPSWYEYFGFLHAAMKAPVKRAEFARSLEKRVENFRRNGGNVNDIDAMGKLAQEAYIDANRAIFMQDNVVSTGFNTMLRSMQNSKKFPNAGPAFARLGQFLVPIVKVPTNIVGEASTGIHGTVTGTVQATKAYLKGVEKLPPEQADAIMRNLKKGLVGNAFLLTGYFGYKSIGGFYQDKEKRSESDVQPEHYKIGGVDLPGFVSHTNAAILMNAGATYRRQQEKKKNPLSAGGAAVSGVIRQLPFVPAATNAVEALKSGEGLDKYIETLVADSTVPALVAHAAKVEDTPGKFPQNAFTHPNKRYPKTMGDRFKAKIPVLRRQVPSSR